MTDSTLARTIETAVRHGTADEPAIAACLTALHALTPGSPANTADLNSGGEGLSSAVPP
ncbi:hypothetical protein [Streptomyces sp. NPDC056730]|uniref:hypothetical protein n=1 Tax=unclassified Streptomyces TaxID=2593676 RepID=UPI0036A9AD9B